MRSGCSQIEQNAREFLLDVHVVARNFAGEQDWLWLKNQNESAAEGQNRSLTRWDRFTDEMVVGAQHYNNNNQLGNRIFLGLTTALYCLPYFAGRMVYDGILNTYEYGAWRITGQAYSPLHPEEGRKINGYVLGAPIALPFVIALGGLESAGRAAGLSQRAGHEVKLAWNSAGYLLKRWTGATYNLETDFKTPLRELFKLPTSWMDGMNCIGLLTGGLAISGTILTVGVLAAGTALAAEGLYRSGRYLGTKAYKGSLVIGEALGRALGISERSGKEISLAWHCAGYLLKRWTEADYSNYDFNATFKQLFEGPKNWRKRMDYVGLLTGGLLVSAAIITVGVLAAGTALAAEGLYRSGRYLGTKAYKGSLVIGEALGRALGISERSGKEISLAWHCAGYLLKRWTEADYSNYDFNATFKQLFEGPKNWRKRMDYVGLLTGGLLVSAAIITVGVLAAGTALAAESLRRALGISGRSQSAISVIFAKCGNMFGLTDPAKLPEKIRLIKAPVRTWWDACDCVGMALTGAISGIISLGLAPLACLGFSKSNYHRFCYYKHHISNLINERINKPANRDLENYHAAELARCEQTKAGYLFSKLNIFNVAARAIFTAARFVVVPAIYATIRLVTRSIPALIGTIYHAIRPPKFDNLTDPIVRVRKRFADLNKALNLHGKLPLPLEGELSAALDIKEAVEAADNRNIFKRVGFTLFSEARRIISLGHTPEEKVLAEFEDTFEQFVNARCRAERRGGPTVPVTQFFKKDVALQNGKRFSYDYMVGHMQGAFSNERDKRAIENIAHLLRNDLEQAIEPGGPAIMP